MVFTVQDESPRETESKVQEPVEDAARLTK